VEGVLVLPQLLPPGLDCLRVVCLHVRPLKRKSLSCERPWGADAAFAAVAPCPTKAAPSRHEV
jgi:hypothetical protein